MNQLAPSSDVLKTVVGFLQGQDIETLVIRRRSGSPWTEFDVWVHMKGIFKFAVWNATLAIHEINDIGAASDDPIKSFPIGLSYHRDLGI